MRIGIDARFYGSIGKGLGRYTQKLIEQLEQIDDHNDYVIFLRRENFDHYVPQNKRFKKVLADFRWYSFAEQMAFPLLLYREHLDLVHFPHFNVPILYWKKIIVTIHDLILLHFPTMRATTLHPVWYKVKFFAYKTVIAAALRRAQRIITISNFTKDDIIKHYPTVRHKIHVTYEACEQYCFRTGKNDDHVLQKYGILKPYLLYVGNAYPHKNLERLLDAFQALHREFSDLQLVLVGKQDYFYQRLAGMIAQHAISNVLLAGFVPDGDLDVIYKNTAAYVFPSLYEGFGLPPLEAMSKGAPVISSDHPCMCEVLGESALLMDAKNKDAIATAIKTMLSNAVVRQEYITKGYQQAQRYNWRTMAQQTLMLYEHKQK